MLKFQQLQGSHLWVHESCTANGMTMKNFPEIRDAPLFEPFFTRRLKMLSRPDGFMLYGKLGVDFFCTPELLYPNLKVRLRLIRARPNLYMLSDNPSLRSWNCWLLALHSSYCSQGRLSQKKNSYACIHSCGVQLFGDSSKDISFPLDKTSSFKWTPVRRIAIAMNTSSDFTGSYIENPFWYQQFDLRQTRILRGGQPIVDFDAADNCRLYVTEMKAMNFQDDMPSIPIDNFKDHYVLVFHLT